MTTEDRIDELERCADAVLSVAVSCDCRQANGCPECVAIRTASAGLRSLVHLIVDRRSEEVVDPRPQPAEASTEIEATEILTMDQATILPIDAAGDLTAEQLRRCGLFTLDDERFFYD